MQTNHSLESLHILWQKKHNPVWVWVAVLACKQSGDVAPPWVIDALSVWAERVLALGANIGDCGRGLPFVFDLEADSAVRHPLKIVASMMEIERVAMAFAFHIFRGRKPSDARSDVAIDFPEWSDERIQASVREHFEITRAPNGNFGWLKIIVAWLGKTPGYETRYPGLPPWRELPGHLARSRAG